jgi:hypothetical protein
MNVPTNRFSLKSHLKICCIRVYQLKKSVLICYSMAEVQQSGAGCSAQASDIFSYLEPNYGLSLLPWPLLPRIVTFQPQ